MAVQFQFLKNDLLTAFVIAIITTILTLINIPRAKFLDENENQYEINRAWVAIKTFILSFIIYYALIYFFSSDPNSSLLSNMKHGEPNF